MTNDKNDMPAKEVDLFFSDLYDYAYAKTIKPPENIKAYDKITYALALQAKIESGELVAVTPDKVDNWNYGEPPKDGSKFYGKYYSPYKWKPYKPQARKQGYPAGRWQCMNEYGGWENAKNPPSQWLTDKDFNEKEKSAPQIEAQEGEHD